MDAMICEQKYLNKYLLQSWKGFWFFEESKKFCKDKDFFSADFVQISGLQKCKMSDFFHQLLPPFHSKH